MGTFGRSGWIADLISSILCSEETDRRSCARRHRPHSRLRARIVVMDGNAGGGRVVRGQAGGRMVGIEVGEGGRRREVMDGMGRGGGRAKLGG